VLVASLAALVGLHRSARRDFAEAGAR
jgi:hypothetical protein